MDQRTAVQSIMSHINNAKRDLEKFPKQGLSKDITDELDLAYNALNDTINHCNTAMKRI